MGVVLGAIRGLSMVSAFGFFENTCLAAHLRTKGNISEMGRISLLIIPSVLREVLQSNTTTLEREQSTQTPTQCFLSKLKGKYMRVASVIGQSTPRY